MSYIHDDFLLQSDPARRLYHEYAKDEPIFDYHCHLSPEDIAKNRQFLDLFEIWLEGDHYKWRAMRTNGVDERFCTGEADPYDKFLAFCRTVPHCLRNPLYHWSHLELKRYFDLDLLIDEESAPVIWEAANAKLGGADMRTQGILKAFDVRLVGTTDDPTDDLEAHERMQSMELSARVIPTFRPDKAMRVDDPAGFTSWCTRLAERSGMAIGTLAQFTDALKSRHDAFHAVGGRASDHGLEACPFLELGEPELDGIYQRALSGTAASAEEQEAFATYILRQVGHWNAEREWVMQFHLGAMRNNSSRSFNELGPDTGFDSIGDAPQGLKLSRLLDSLDRDRALPRTVLYNLNPADNYLFATMIGNFQDGSVAGKIQYGSGWWFLDQKEAMEWQLNAVSNNGLLSRFIGMLTDSRSFMSFPRHEYFRRVLCNLVGKDMETGEIPMDFELVGGMVHGICYRNASEFFKI